MGKILIHDLSASFRVGVTDEERSFPQRLLVSVEMRLDLTAAAESDDLSRTIDYHAVSQKIANFGANRSWKLIEKLAADIGSMILREHHPLSVLVTIKKFILPEAEYVAVQIERS